MATEDGSEYFNIDFLNKDFVKNYKCQTDIKKPFKSVLKKCSIH